jgi:hypothetical protein
MNWGGEKAGKAGLLTGGLPEKPALPPDTAAVRRVGVVTGPRTGTVSGV